MTVSSNWRAVMQPGDEAPADATAGNVASRGVAGWLCLAAAPTFAIMALATAASGDMICMAAPDASPLGGMVPMYVLMSAFHLPPWLKLVASRRSGGRRPVVPAP